MKMFILIMLSISIFAGGYGSTGTWPTDKRVINLEEVLKIKPSFKLEKFENGIVKLNKETGFLLLKTKTRVVAVKSIVDVSDFKKKRMDMNEMVDFEMFYESSRENAVLRVKDMVNSQELLPFNMEDFL